jgi:hypothetical protein
MGFLDLLNQLLSNDERVLQDNLQPSWWKGYPCVA